MSLPFFGRKEPRIERSEATTRIEVRGSGVTRSDVWAALTKMFEGKEACIVLNLDRLIPISSGPVQNGAEFEDYNWAGPRRPLRITSWNPANGVLSFRIDAPDSVEEKYRSNSWEYQFILDEDSPKELVQIDLQLVIHHDRRAGMSAVRTLELDVSTICNETLRASGRKIERMKVEPGLSSRWRR